MMFSIVGEKRILEKVELVMASILCAETEGELNIPSKMGRYTISKQYWEDKFMYILSEREIRFRTNLSTSYHHAHHIDAHSPLGALVINQSHRIIGCGQGLTMYTNHIRASGFNAVNLEEAVATHRDSCKLCPMIRMLFSRKTLLTKIL